MLRTARCWMLGCIVTTLLAMVQLAWADVFPSNLPQMSGGTVNDPVTVTSDSWFYYSLKQKDLDTIAPNVQIRDDTCTIQPVFIQSMQPNTLQYGLSRVEGDGTMFWGISGKAITTTVETRRVDEWRLYNNRLDALRDEPIPVFQTVIIRPPATQPPAPQPPGGGA